jgi:hypothetical protein
VEKQAGGVYVLPDDGDQPKAKQSDDEDDNFL